MDGSQVQEGKRLLENSGLNVQTSDSLGDGASRIVRMIG
jgi:succinyl-CoA synthetase beta subunit